MKGMFLGFLLFLAQSLALADGPVPTIGKDLRLHVDGKPFFIRGMAYAPEPRGFPGNKLTSSNGPWPYSRGAWLCKAANQYDPGDWQSPCADDDFFGLLTENTQANRDYNAALRELWGRDLKTMQAMGVNTLRIYNANQPRFKNHLPFLNAVQASGMHVIWPVLTDHLARTQFDESIIENMVKETCPGGSPHPALLAYTAGNELTPISNDTDKFRIRRSIEIVKKLCPTALVTYAHNDVPPEWTLQPNPQNGSSALMEAFPALDFLTVNVYRNNPNTGGIEGYDRLFRYDISNLTNKYQKPVLIGEVGEHQNDRYESTWFNRTWKFILQNSVDAKNLGVVYFEFNDEPVKKQKSGTSNDAYMGIATSAWPPATNMEAVTEPAVIMKNMAYSGIQAFNNGSDHIDFPGSAKGAGRYDMFVNTAQGIQACNFKASPDPQSINPSCLNAR
ncbi:glycoside hydrolase 5 family protein [Noviherbaspirillum pedocola]|uniref:Glycoside hydrolase family 2 catalytic domain-containing protein n=1 Tax=Noviherbaspirillum pedocola TaxID=2801341 RepID=A0A934SZT4_9BURK|nr:hypothetical protein [Noviherbaspirillum pedocola]MBK4735764.1 hypothetical protein [Noviherbaspirillum pedocola]